MIKVTVDEMVEMINDDIGNWPFLALIKARHEIEHPCVPPLSCLFGFPALPISQVNLGCTFLSYLPCKHELEFYTMGQWFQ